MFDFMRYNISANQWNCGCFLGTFEAEKDPVLFGLVHPLESFNPLYTQVKDYLNRLCDFSVFNRISMFLTPPPQKKPQNNNRLKTIHKI